MPPPNITGQLHIGHALDEMPQDVLIRYHRMKGDPTLWVPGTDHASIATEVKIVDALKKEDLTKQDVGREKFLERAWAWKREYGGRIVKQLRKLGVSCDWKHERFTMDDGLSRAVRETFVRYYEKGPDLSRRPHHQLVPDLQDGAVRRRGRIRRAAVPPVVHPLSGPRRLRRGRRHHPARRRCSATPACASTPTTSATPVWWARPVLLPIMNRQIPVVADDYADMEFGTGRGQDDPRARPERL